MKNTFTFSHPVFLMCFGLLFLASCTPKKENKSENVEKMLVADSLSEQKTVNQDSIQLLQLTRHLYQWVNAHDTTPDFDPQLERPSDTLYKKLNAKLFQIRKKQLLESRLFTLSFLKNYDDLYTSINQKLGDGTYQYEVGTVPPYGSDANPWCNCQDAPDEYWKTLNIENLELNTNTASFDWTWGEDFSYKVRAEKEDGLWKISYLEGFDARLMIDNL